MPPSQIRFEEPTEYGRPQHVEKSSVITRMVIATGLASDEQDAARILIIFTVIAIALTVLILVRTASPAHPAYGPVPQGTSLTVPG